MKQRTAAAAVGKWYGLLSHFGMDERFLRNVHGECPMCGGSDRYRWDDKNGTGSYYCNQCGSGDGLDLAIRFTGKDFKAVTAEIDKIVGNVQSRPIKAASNNSEKIKKILSECIDAPVDGDVRRYLRARGVPFSKMLREHPGLGYYEDGVKVGTFPAMIARMVDHHGALTGIHVTYLQDGAKANVPATKKIFKMGDTMPPSIVMLTVQHDVIGIAEGIETALAVMKKFNVPCWAATSAGMIEKFTPPNGIKALKIFADNDASFTGQKAAYVLANRLYQKYAVEVIIPENIGDWAD